MSCSPTPNLDGSPEPKYILAVFFCVLFLIVALMEAVLIIILYLSYRKVKLGTSGVQAKSQRLLRLPHWATFKRFKFNGSLTRRSSATKSSYKLAAEGTTRGTKKPGTPSSIADTHNYSELLLTANNGSGRHEGPVLLPTAAAYEEPFHSASGSSSPSTHHTFPRKLPEAVVPTPKPREQRSLSTGKTTELPLITVEMVQDQHTPSKGKRVKDCQPDDHRYTDPPPSTAAKPVHLAMSQTPGSKRSKFLRRKSNPRPVSTKPVPVTVFATYSTAQDPGSEVTRTRASTGSRPPIRPKPKGSILSSYSLASSGPPDNTTTGEECEYDIAISSVVLSSANEPKEEYDFPLPYNSTCKSH